MPFSMLPMRRSSINEKNNCLQAESTRQHIMKKGCTGKGRRREDWSTIDSTWTGLLKSDSRGCERAAHLVVKAQLALGHAREEGAHL